MAPTRPATAAKAKAKAGKGKSAAGSKKAVLKPVTKKKTAPPKKPEPTIAEQIVKMKEKPKKEWIKADYVKYSQLLEQMHAGAADPPAEEQPEFPDDESEPPSPLPAMGPSPKAGGAKGPLKPTVPSPTPKPTVPSPTPKPESSERKLEPPKVKFDGTGDYDTFRRQVLIWEGKYDGRYSQAKLGAELMEVVSAEALEAIFALVPEKSERLDLILKALDQRFGKKAMPKATAAVENFAKCTRGKKTLRSFLNEYGALRAKAMTAGEKMCPTTSGTKLLKAAELSAALHTQILATIAASGQITAEGQHLPSFESVLEQLEILAQTYEAQDAEKKERNAFATLSEGGGGKGFGGKGAGGQGAGTGKGKGAGKGKGGGKGKYGKGKGGGKGKDSQQFAGGWQGKVGKGKGGSKGYGKSGGKDGDKGQGKGQGPCWEWQQWKTCRFGADCKFSHGQAEKREAPEEEGPDAKKPRVR